MKVLLIINGLQFYLISKGGVLELCPFSNCVSGRYNYNIVKLDTSYFFCSRVCVKISR